MNITFFIGNGFDINLGLNTRYSDFYPYFINNARKNNMIKTWLQDDELLWADLEKKLGESLKKVDKDSQAQFYEDKAELDRLLLEYLEQEQKRFSTQNREKELAEKFAGDLKNFYNDLSDAGKEAIQSIFHTYGYEDFKYCFVSFNYTSMLDQIVNITRKCQSPIAVRTSAGGQRKNLIGELIHIHGTLNEEMVLGVNDKDQINNDELKKNNEFLSVFVKSEMNANMGQGKTEHVQQIIKDSGIICIFGASIGSTDKMWWKEIINWLNVSDKHKLIIFYKGHKKELERKIPIVTILLSNNIKNNLIENGEADKGNPNTDKIKQQIYISYNSNIFNFDKLGLVSASDKQGAIDRDIC